MVRISVILLALVVSGVYAQTPPGQTVAQVYPPEGSYVVVVGKETYEIPEWREVVDVLREKYDASLIVFDAGPADVVAPLSRIMPRYTCFVRRPTETDRPFIVDVHRALRNLDSDPYTDTIWGILTGYDASDALRIARVRFFSRWCG